MGHTEGFTNDTEIQRNEKVDAEIRWSLSSGSDLISSVFLAYIHLKPHWLNSKQIDKKLVIHTNIQHLSTTLYNEGIQD